MTESKNTFLTQNLIIRVLSSLVLIPVVLGTVWAGNWAFQALILLVSILGMAEWVRLTAPNLSVRGKTWAFVGLFLILVIGSFKGMSHAIVLSVPTALLLGYYAGCAGDQETRLSLRLWGGLGIPYLAWSALAMIYLRNIPDLGVGLIVYLMLVVWATDIGAYFAGRLIGGPKLLPLISPKKTWAGLIGGMVFAGVVGYCVALGVAESRSLAAAVVAMVMAVVAQAGDFFESYVKRRAGAKDSGTIIPGHGGVLDRVDGLLFAAVFLALLVSLGA